MLLVKLGGGDVDLDAVAEDLAGLGRPFVLLHGANKLRDRLAADLGRPPEVVRSVSGYTSVLTDDDAMDVMLAAYAGIRNKRIVEALRRRGVDAIGLTGLDGGMVSGTRNRGIRVERDGRKLLLRDHSGKPRALNGDLLSGLLADGYTPVLTVPIAGEDGSALNTENDEILALLAAELRATEVVSLMDEAGLLDDPTDPSTLVPRLEAPELEAWEERVDGRMRRKMRALGTLFERSDVPDLVFHLGDGRVERPVSAALSGSGTTIRRGTPADTEIEGDGGVSSPGHGPSWLERQAAHELDVYGKRGLTLVAARGARVTDDGGRSYLDCVGGNGSLALGHRHPALEAALADQARRVWTVPGAFVSPARTRFLEGLHAILPAELTRTFLSNSGTESVEAALKIARAHTGRGGFVAAERGFHGRTMGALSVTAGARYREPFAPLLPGVQRVPYDDVDALRAAVDGEVAAVVLEPVQGEGGVRIPSPGFLRDVRAVCDEAGALLVLDEVQTGFGRTGKLFAFEHSGVVPDVLCLAKSIAGGLPLGATVVRDGIDLPLGTHGSTFGGNPLACAVASATLDVLSEPGLLKGVERLGGIICDPVVEAAPRVVREVRRVGLMIGIELRVPVRPYLAALQDRNVLALSAGRTVLRLLPPLNLTLDEASEIAATLLEVLSEDP